LNSLKHILAHIESLKANRHKAIALLIDPDKCSDLESISRLLQMAESCSVDFLFVGGSLLTTDHFETSVAFIKEQCSIPVILFPGSAQQVSHHADALFMLSLISGRNAELLIGQQVQAAPKIKAVGIEVIPTGYLLVDCGNATTASYITQTMPIPFDKPDIAAVTVLAGEMLGLRVFYLDGGSGAKQPISSTMINLVSHATRRPLIVGGGIKSYEDASSAFQAGADIIVVGTAIEKNPDLLFDLTKAKKDAIFTP
jgi:phosphoglycerol geranylgeranyltransferase